MTRPPSQSPDREECVFIVAENMETTRSVMLPIRRNRKGGFNGFGSCDLPDIDKLTGRFAGMMPPNQPSPEDRKMARHLLLSMGVAPDNMGFNPQWN